MPFRVLDANVRAACQSAASQQEQLQIITNAFAAQAITARFEGAALRASITLPAPIVSSTEPRSIVLGETLTHLHSSTGDVTTCVLRNSSGTGILVAAAQTGSGTATIDLFGPIKQYCPPSLVGVTITADNLLPLFGLPTWRQGQSVGEIRTISGTAFPVNISNAVINAWGTLPVVPPATFVSPANGGHQDTGDNGVYSIDLIQDNPTWVTRIPASTVIAPLTTDGVDYYSDNKPTSRHGYHHAHYISQRNKLYLFGARGRWSAAGADGFYVDAHTVSGATWEWDTATSNGIVQGSNSFGAAHDPTTGNVWTNAGRLWTQSTGAWSWPNSGFPVSWRWPAAYDSLRAQFFTLQYGDGQGFDPQRSVVATKFNKNTGAQEVITFNSSAALTQFIADAPQYAAMDYDAVNDNFLFYEGRASSNDQRIYVITPNSGTTWDISILNTSGLAIPAGPTSGSGINGRFRYVPALGGFAWMPNSTGGFYFLRTN